jgi:integrase
VISSPYARSGWHSETQKGMGRISFIAPSFIHPPRSVKLEPFPSNRKTGEKLLDIKKGFKKSVQLAGIPPIRFHDMRHTFATRLVRAGVDSISVQHLLEHSKITMTARYAHSLADVKMAAVSKLDLAGVCSLPDPKRTPSPTGVVAESEVNSFAASI